MRLPGTIVAWMLLAQVHGAAAQAVPLPVKGNLFHPTAMAFSADGGQVCVAGSDFDEMGSKGGRIMLIDRVHHVLLWQKTFPLPEDYAGIAPVQCAIADRRVYLLANMITQISPPLSQTLTAVYSFDENGRQLARQELKSPARNQTAYAMSATADGIKVAGYLEDEDDQFEYYAVFSVALNRALQVQGAPVIRKNGAYGLWPGARIVGDDLYIGGIFFPAKIAKNDKGPDDFAVSRLRLSGAYLWSVHSAFGTLASSSVGVAEDGTVYALRYSRASTSILTVPPDGKPLPVATYVSSYCDTGKILGYGTYLLALRESCDHKAGHAGAVVLKIDPATGHEEVLGGAVDQAEAIATSGALWAAVMRGKNKQLYFYSSATR